MDRPCEVFVNDLRVKVSQTGLYTDVIAVCGLPAFEDAEADTLLNPMLIIEVLSPSTESYDRGRKFAHYRRLPSLQEYILVSQTECRMEKYLKQDGGTWLYSEHTDPTASIELPSMVCRLPIASVYHKVMFG